MNASQGSLSKRHSLSSGTPRRPSLSRRKSPSENGSIDHHMNTLHPSKAAVPSPSISGPRERTVRRLRLSRALTISEGTTVLDACRRMATRRVDAALLTDSQALLCGIITDKDVATRVIAEGLRPDETAVCKVMTKHPQFVMSETMAVDALQKMVQGKFRHLPVVDNHEVVALLDITKCLYDAIVRLEKAAEKGEAIAAAVQGVELQFGSSNFMDILRERMFRPTLGSVLENDPEAFRVVTVSPMDTVYTATRKMRDRRANALITTKNNKPIGILTSKDILLKVVVQNLLPESTSVEKVMTPDPEFATIDTTIVDALHMMHDGKFLNLPVVDREGSIVACLDVLNLTHAALAAMSNEGVADLTSTIMQRFWDSSLTLGSAEDENEAHSDNSMSKYSEVIPDDQKYSTLGSGTTFGFKLEDPFGHVHRFNIRSETLTELSLAIAQRVGFRKLLHLMYEDDEGDRVMLTSDSDLSAAINHARSLGWKVLKLHLEYAQEAPKNNIPQFKEKNASHGESTLTVESVRHQMWTSTYSAALAGGAIAVGVSLLIFLKRFSV